MVGIYLKNKIKSHYPLWDINLCQFIKVVCLHALNAVKARHLSNTLSTLITTIVMCEEGILQWPDLLPTLLGLLDNEVPSIVEGAFNALFFICEDHSRALLDESSGGEGPLHILIPKCLSFFSNPNNVLRRYALGCINHYVNLMPPVLIANLNQDN